MPLSGDTRRKLIFLKKQQYFGSHFHETMDRNIFFSQQDADADHVVRDHAHDLVSHENENILTNSFGPN